MNAPILSAASRAAHLKLSSPTGGLWWAVLLGSLALLPSVSRAQLYPAPSTIHGDAVSGERFGLNVAASNDTIVVGTPSGGAHGPYRAHVFVRASTGWETQQKIDFPTTDGVAIDGNTLVGGGAIYVRSGGTWTLQQTIGNFEHPEPALQGDTLVLGNPHDRTQNHGSLAVYTRSGSTWTQHTTFGPDGDAGPNDMMGDSVALDGDTLLAGTATGVRGAYVFVRSGTTWSPQGHLAPLSPVNSRTTVALEGDTAVVGFSSINQVHIFTRSGTTWTRTQILFPPAGGNFFGDHLSIDGGILAVAAVKDAGALLYLYAHTSAGWILAQTIDRTAGPYAYYPELALANNGKLFVVGNAADNFSVGVAEIFSVPPPPAPGSGWRDTDIGAVGVAGSSSVTGDAGSVSGSGADIWDRADQFHFRSETLTGDGAIVARVTSAGTTHSWAKAGLMFREDVAPAARTVMALVTPGAHLGTQVRSATADTTAFQDAGWAAAPIWLMLSRTGDHFDAFRSDDGDHWTAIGSTTMTLPATIHVGLAVSSHDNAALNTGTFSGIELVRAEAPPPPPPPPARLLGNDVGPVGLAGSFTDSGGTVTIDAAGADLWNLADSGYFAHREVVGDFDLRARVASLTNTHPWAKAGIMVRESLLAGSRNVFTLVTAGNTAGMQVRNASDGSTSFTSGPWVNAPYWVRLVRTGNTFQSMISGDGTSWQIVGTQTLALSASLRAGLAVSSHDSGTATHATFDSLQLGD